ncbi:MAG TPA: hypothetical protein ENK06_07650 [Gammaproteobacteria bacterium]|nr:hypothetical protein [Gammaproteobacteria bacterium]
MKYAVNKCALALAIMGAFGLSACKDGAQEAPINKSTTGVITGFGSVFVNGVEYETDNARFVVDGVEGGEGLLKLGMLVSLSGTTKEDGTGTAVSITFNDDVEGVVINNEVDAAGIGTLNIMGLTVEVDEDTVFDSSVDGILSVVDVVPGNIVEVSGHSSGDGNVLATRLEVKSVAQEAGKEMEVKGYISKLDEQAMTFTLGSMVIDFSNAELKLEKGAGALNDGLFVEVKTVSGIEGEMLIASKIELEAGGKKSLAQGSSEETELEGVINRVLGTTEIEVNGHRVLLSDTTRYVHGTAELVAAGMKLKVKGDVNEAGELVAQKVVFKPSGDVKVAGKVDALDVAANTLSIFGISFTLNNSTMVKDDRDHDALANGEENIKYKFGVDDLAKGDWIKAKAYTNKEGGLTLTKMARKTYEAGKLEALEGKLTVDGTNSNYFVAGIRVDLSSTSILPLDGMKVELKGQYTDGVFVVSKAEEKAREENYTHHG